MSCGEKSPAAFAELRKFPLESNLSIRLLAASTTNTWPDESVAAACGWLNCPSAVPVPPKVFDGPNAEAAPAEAGVTRATSATAKASDVAILRISRYPQD